MKWWNRLLESGRRLRLLFRPRESFDREMEEEMRLHRDLRARENRETGLDPEEAAYSAQRRFGNTLKLREQVHEAWSWRWLDNFGRDLKYGARRLRHQPGFTTVAVLTLALGIGANTSIFSLIQQVMFTPLPVEHANELYSLGDDKNGCCGGGFQGDFSVYSYPLYLYLREHTQEFSDLAAFSSGDEALGVRRAGNPNAARAFRGESVSGNYFSTLGVKAYAGRLLEPADDQPNAPPVLVMSYRAWREKFSSDRGLIGQTLVVKGVPMIVAGITPPEFFGDTLRSDPPDIYMSLAMEATLHPEASLLEHWNEYWLYAIGRLRPEAQPAQVQAHVTAELQQWLRENYVAERFNSDAYLAARYTKDISKQYIVVIPAAGGVAYTRDNKREALRLLMTISLLVLLLACANIASLLLARGASSRQQTAVRMALGASRSRILGQMMTEGLLLAMIGGAVGAWISMAATRGILSLAFHDAEFIPIRMVPSLPVLGFAFVASIVTGLVFSAAPAWIGSQAQPVEPMRGAGRSTRDRSLLPQKSLLVVQAAVSLVLLVAAGLLTLSLRRMEQQKSSGVETQGRLMAWINLPRNQFPSRRLGSLYRNLQERLAGIPGVLSSSFSNGTPVSQGIIVEPISIAGKPPVPLLANGRWPAENRVGPRYFETVGTRLVRGRVIDERDTSASQHVAVVDEAFAHFFFSNEDPIGRHFGIQTQEHGSDYEIVGIVENAHYPAPRIMAYPTFFLPLLQEEKYADTAEELEQFDSQYANVVELRVAGRPQDFAAPLRRALAATDPNLVFIRARTFTEQLDRNFDQERMVARLTTLYGLLALLLASVGLYGVASYAAARRINEIGIRMALGADRGSVMRMMMGVALQPVGLGLMIGIPIALVGARAAASQLYGVRIYDPLTFAAAVVVLGIFAAAAGYLPARRAASIDPM
ncbi:MAG TPA: ABC transporter permease [Candidatus Angelobacter sp.]|nr:ABC transporter permease [Candidatus Angelobacter sp.]